MTGISWNAFVVEVSIDLQPQASCLSALCLRNLAVCLLSGLSTLGDHAKMNFSAITLLLSAMVIRTRFLETA